MFDFCFWLVANNARRRLSWMLPSGNTNPVFDSTLDGILILDNEGVCIEANPAALTLLERLTRTRWAAD